MTTGSRRADGSSDPGMTEQTRTRSRVTVSRLLLWLAVIGLITAACSDSTEDGATAEPPFDDPADASFDEPAGQPAEEPAGEPARATSGFDEPADEGLFAPESRAEPDPMRLEDNVFRDYGVRPFVDPAEDPLSTFALDVDTGSYTIARRWLTEGVLPQPESIRVEEIVNWFDYGYRVPDSGLEMSVDGGPSPFDEGDVLVRIGVQATEIDDAERQRASLTFVVDTSGSMDRDDRLGLVKEALEELVEELDRDDTVAIVTYGDSSNVVLEPTSADERQLILGSIDDLRPGGSTNLEAGLRTGYELAQQAFAEDGINRVILASDGVANVGNTDAARLADEIHEQAINGIQLVTVGFGMGNFNDVTMEQLADRGDGFYAYVDTPDEAYRLFQDELVSTLTPIAIDARIQIEWSDVHVDRYRLLGFENRGVLDDDFRSTEVNAGELFSGHSVTAIYELELDPDTQPGVDLGEIALRWQDPDSREWVETTEAVGYDAIELEWSRATEPMRLATTVAAWAEVLRDSPHAAGVDLDAVAHEASSLAGEIRTDQVTEFADLTDLAVLLSQ